MNSDLDLELTKGDTVTIGGLKHYADLQLVHHDGQMDRPGVEPFSHLILVRRDTETARRIAQHFEEKP